MNFLEALEALGDGKRVADVTWGEWYLVWKDERIQLAPARSFECWTQEWELPNPKDLAKSKWEIFNEAT